MKLGNDGGKVRMLPKVSHRIGSRLLSQAIAINVTSLFSSLLKAGKGISSKSRNQEHFVWPLHCAPRRLDMTSDVLHCSGHRQNLQGGRAEVVNQSLKIARSPNVVSDGQCMHACIFCRETPEDTSSTALQRTADPDLVLFPRGVVL